jgi:hypothetical protein
MSRQSLLLILSGCLIVAMFGAAAFGGSGQAPSVAPLARTGDVTGDLAALAPAAAAKARSGRRPEVRSATRMTAS